MCSRRQKNKGVKAETKTPLQEARLEQGSNCEDSQSTSIPKTEDIKQATQTTENLDESIVRKQESLTKHFTKARKKRFYSRRASRTNKSNTEVSEVLKDANKSKSFSQNI